MKNTLILALSISVHMTIFSQCKLNYDALTLIHNDEFNSAEELFERWAHRPNNGRPVIFEHDPDMISVEDGKLILRGEPTGSTTWPLYRTGSVRTIDYYPDGNFEDSDNMIYVEAKVKMPQGQGIVPAFWASTVGFEIDVFEYNDNGVELFGQNVIKDPGTPESEVCGRIWRDAAGELFCHNLSDEFHRFGVAWKPRTSNSQVTDVTFFLDGRELWTQTVHQIPINSGMGINLTNQFDAHVPFDLESNEFVIEYVRIYEVEDDNLLKLEEPIIGGNKHCHERGFSMVATRTNQVFFRHGDFVGMYYKSNQNYTYQFVHLTNNFDISERVTGDITSRTETGEVVYRGYGNQLHRYYYQNSGWQHDIISTNTVSFEMGSISMEKCDNIYFKNSTHDIILLEADQFGGYTETNLTNHLPFNYKAKNDLSSGHRTLYYKGQDNFLQAVYFDFSTNTWKHQNIINQFGEKIRIREDAGSLELDRKTNRIYFVELDGNISYVVFVPGSGYEQYPVLTNNFGSSPTRITVARDEDNAIVFHNSLTNEIEIVLEDQISGTWDLKATGVYSAGSNTIFGVNNMILYRDISTGNLKNMLWKPCSSYDNCSLQAPFERKTKPNTHPTVKLYPNPVVDELVIKGQNLTGAATISIHNSVGQLVLEQRVHNFIEDRIDIQELTRGLYLLHIEFDNGIVEKDMKFIKM